MVVLEDDFTGTGLMGGRTPDTSGWVSGGVWAHDTDNGPRVVNIGGGRATSEAAGGSQYYYPVLPPDATIPAPDTEDGFVASWRPVINAEYSQGTVSFEGPYTELDIFDRPIARYYIYVFWGWPGQFKVGVSMAQRDIKIPPWDDNPSAFMEVAVPSVAQGSTPEIKVQVDKATGNVELIVNGATVANVTTGYSFVDPQVTSVLMTWSSGNTSIESFRLGDGAPQPVGEPFWTGFNNAYEVP